MSLIKKLALLCTSDWWKIYVLLTDLCIKEVHMSEKRFYLTLLLLLTSEKYTFNWTIFQNSRSKLKVFIYLRFLCNWNSFAVLVCKLFHRYLVVRSMLTFFMRPPNMICQILLKNEAFYVPELRVDSVRFWIAEFFIKTQAVAEGQ